MKHTLSLCGMAVWILWLGASDNGKDWSKIVLGANPTRNTCMAQMKPFAGYTERSAKKVNIVSRSDHSNRTAIVAVSFHGTTAWIYECIDSESLPKPPPSAAPQPEPQPPQHPKEM